MTITKIQKRTGDIVKFEKQKIVNAIYKAAVSIKKPDKALAKGVADKVVQKLNKRFKGRIPHVEDIQDLVEVTLIEVNRAEVAKAYILYRQHRADIREHKKFIGVEDDVKISVNAARVLHERYLLKDKERKVIETPSQMFKRVAKAIASAEKNKLRPLWEKRFYEIMKNLEFLPNTPTLMNAGTKIGQLSACFVLPIHDSLDSIYNTLKLTAKIHQTAGGTGFDFSELRQKGAVIQSTKGISSGPLSFLKIFDTSTEIMKSGGKRRGANQGVLRVDHPDILEFITAKASGGYTNFNLSVAVTDEFMKAVKKDKIFNLIDPKTKQVVKKVEARTLFDLMIYNAWVCGDPCVIFIDEMNRNNPTPKLGNFTATNPCAELPLLPYESCNLGSINLSKFVKRKRLDRKKLSRTIKYAVRFLDNVIDVNKYPLKQIEKMTKANRKIGLGIMGFSDMLILMGIKYNSKQALKIAENIMRFIKKEATKASHTLARQKGAFPNWKISKYRKKQRNATLTSIAPTGSISIIANCSSSIEPLFAVSFMRNILGGAQLLETNQHFENMAKEQGFYSKRLMMKVAQQGSIQKMDEIPAQIRKLFVTSHDIKPEWHVKMQSAFQKYVDNAISKTVNMSGDASIDDVEKIFMLAWRNKCKGITVYRYGAKANQVLNLGAFSHEITCPKGYCP